MERISATHPRIVELLETPLLNMLLRVPGQLACLLLEVSATCALQCNSLCTCMNHDWFRGDLPSSVGWWL